MKNSGKFNNKNSFNETITTNGYWKEIEINNSDEMIEHYDEYTEDIVLQSEREKIGLKTEIGTIISRDGTILEKLDGAEHSIEVKNIAKEKFKNNIFTHNHPMGGNFSTDDINSFLNYDLYSMF